MLHRITKAYIIVNVVLKKATQQKGKYETDTKNMELFLRFCRCNLCVP